MTRGMFFKVLAAMGMGQATTHIETTLPISHGGTAQVGPCKEGEERCPLGHCQDPFGVVGRQSFVQVVYFYAENAHHQPSDRTPIDIHICSHCGIVYVPVKVGG